jgi:maleate cis-trans isomerase
VPFNEAQNISPEVLYAHIKTLFRKHKGANGIYIQGGAWHTESIVETLEQDLGVPVVHANIAPAWEIMMRLRVNAPREGYGRLLRELPKMV